MSQEDCQEASNRNSCQNPLACVTNVGSVETSRFLEAVAASPDGGYVYAVGDAGKDLDVFKINGTSLTEVLPRISLGNDHPASIAASPK